MTIGWVIAAAVGAAAAGGLLLHPPSRLAVGPRGLLDRHSGLGWIPWDEIEGAYRPSGTRTDAVRLRVRVTERLARVLLRRRPELAPAAGRPRTIELDLELAGTELTPVELLRRILRGSD